MTNRLTSRNLVEKRDLDVQKKWMNWFEVFNRGKLDFWGKISCKTLQIMDRTLQKIYRTLQMSIQDSQFATFLGFLQNFLDEKFEKKIKNILNSFFCRASNPIHKTLSSTTISKSWTKRCKNTWNTNWPVS